MKKLKLLFFLIVIIHVSVWSQNHPNGVDFLIDGVQYPNFVAVGVPGGIPENPPGDTYNVSDYSGTDREKIQAAVDAAEDAGGGIVFIPSGTYTLDNGILIERDNIVIRGAGIDQTTVILNSTSDNDKESAAFSFVGGGSDYSYHFFNANVEKGDKVLIMADNYGYSAGDFIFTRVHYIDAIVKNDFYRKKYYHYNSSFQKWAYCHELPYQIEAVSDDGKVIELTEPIRLGFKKSDPDLEKEYRSIIRRASMIKNCGVEDLRIETTVSPSLNQTSGIYFYYAYSSWVKNVYVYRAGSIPINFRYSKNVEIRNSVMDQAQNLGGGGNGYGVFWTVNQGLMDGVQTYSLRHAPNFQAYATGCVIRNSDFHDSDGQWHIAWTMENLIEESTITVTDNSPAASLLMLSTELSATTTGHTPHFHGNIVYHNDLKTTQTNSYRGIVLGGLHKDWVFAYNNIEVSQNMAAVAIGDWSDNLVFKGNNIAMKNYTGNNNEYAVSFYSGAWDTVNFVYKAGSAHNKNIKFIDNTFIGFPVERLYNEKFDSVDIKTNNAVLSSYSEPEMPAPAISSLYEYQKAYVESQPTIQFVTPLQGSNYKLGDIIPIEITTTGGDFGVPEKAEFYFNGEKIGEDNDTPFSMSWNSNIHSGFDYGRLSAKLIYPVDTLVDFVKIKVEGVQYKLDVSVDNGTLDIHPPGEMFFEGTEVTLFAKGKLGYAFRNWEGDITGTTNPVSFKVDSNMIVKPVFESVPIVTVALSTPDGRGSVVIEPSGGEYSKGEEVVIIGQPEKGYAFERWSGDLSNNSQVYKFVVDSNMNISAHFVLDTTPEPLAWYRFENNSNDEMGSFHIMHPVTPSYSSTDSKEGDYCLVLPGESDQRGTIDFHEFKSAFSSRCFSLWFKANNTYNNQILFEEGGSSRGMAIRINEDKIEGRVSNNFNNLDVSTPFISGEWTHVILHYDSDTLSLIVNGVLEDKNTGNNIFTVEEHIDPSTIGASYWDDCFGGSGNFSGLIDDLRVFDYFLEESQLENVYGGPLLLSNPDILARSAGNDLKIFPNPASSHIWINIPDIQLITMYSLDGKRIDISNETEIFEDKLAVNIEKIEAGVYFLKLQEGKKVYTLRFVKL